MLVSKMVIIIIKLTIPKNTLEFWKIIYQIIKYLSNAHQGSMVFVYFSSISFVSTRSDFLNLLLRSFFFGQ